LKRIASAFILLMIAFLAFAPASLAQSDQVTVEVQQTIDEVEAIRGLELISPLEITWVSQEEAEQMQLEEIEGEPTSKDAGLYQQLFTLLGFLGPGEDYGEIMKSVSLEGMSFYYDVEAFHAYLIGDGSVLSAENRMNLSYIVNYALQSQYFGTEQPPFSVMSATNDDAVTAADCLMIGDAELTSELLIEGFTEEQINELMEAYSDYEMPLTDAAPQIVVDTMSFPYEEGLIFVNYLYGQNGFNTVNQAYDEPPASTEQVMHPKKYLAGEEPIEVNCKDVLPELDEGWSLNYANVLGEFDIYELLMTELRSSEASSGADGWGGCQCRVYENEGNGQVMLLADLAWDTRADAEEFTKYFGDYVEKRFDMGTGSSESMDDWAVWGGEEGEYAALSLNGDDTYFIVSTDADATVQAIGGLGNGEPALREVLNQYNREKTSLGNGEKSAVNWTALAVILGFLLLVLIILVVMLLVSRRERMAREIYPPYMQQPPGWPQRPPQTYGPYQPLPPPIPPQYRPPQPPVMQPPVPPQPPNLPPPAGDA
jgi:hypothetical protein